MLDIATPIVAGSELQRDSISSRLEEGYLDATTLMEWMIKKGMPQRRAHHLVGAMVGEAMNRKVALKDLPLETYQSYAPEMDATIYDCLGTENAVAAFVSFGSTAPTQVAAQIENWKANLTS